MKARKHIKFINHICVAIKSNHCQQSYKPTWYTTLAISIFLRISKDYLCIESIYRETKECNSINWGYITWKVEVQNILTFWVIEYMSKTCKKKKNVVSKSKLFLFRDAWFCSRSMFSDGLCDWSDYVLVPIQSIIYLVPCVPHLWPLQNLKKISFKRCSCARQQ